MYEINSKTYFQNNSKIKKTYPYLSNDIKCDVLIIGGGITGAITAFYLAKEGLDVVVAEKNIIGYGNTIKDTTFIDYNFDIYRNNEKKTEIIQDILNDSMNKLIKINEKMLDNNIIIQDSLYFTNKIILNSNLKKQMEMLNNLGLDSKYISDYDVIKINKGILTKKGSAFVNYYNFTQNLFSYLNSKENVKIFENTSIEEIDAFAYGVKSYTQNGFNITSNSVIIASGADGIKYFDYDDLLELYKNCTMVSKPLKKDKINYFSAIESGDKSFYYSLDKEGRVICSLKGIKYNSKFLDDKYINNFLNDRYKKMESHIDKIFGEKIEPEFVYNYNEVLTNDGLPIIDEIPNMPNCFCNLSFGNNGILYSIVGAEMLKNAINGLFSKNMELFKIDR